MQGCAPAPGVFPAPEFPSGSRTGHVAVPEETTPLAPAGSRETRRYKTKTPSHRRSKLASQQIARRRTDGDRQVKDTENAAAFVFRKKVRDKGGRDGDKRRLTDTHQRMTEQQLSVRVGDRSE